MNSMIRKYDIILASLDTTQGSEQRGIRPCMVVQNNRVNELSRTLVVCPFSSNVKAFFFALPVKPSALNGLSVISQLDILQIRTIDKTRMIKNIGRLEESYWPQFKTCFEESFDLNDWF